MAQPGVENSVMSSNGKVPGLTRLAMLNSGSPSGCIAAGAVEDVHLAGEQPAALGGLEDVLAREGAVRSW
jgi:hypothetical protein